MAFSTGQAQPLCGSVTHLPRAAQHALRTAAFTPMLQAGFSVISALEEELGVERKLALRLLCVVRTLVQHRAACSLRHVEDGGASAPSLA